MIKNPKTVWQTITRVPKSKSKAITASLDNSNNFFLRHCWESYWETPRIRAEDKITNSDWQHMPVEIHYNDIQNTIKKIRNDCSTDFDVVSYCQQLHKARYFRRLWKITNICTIPKLSSPNVAFDYRLI